MHRPEVRHRLEPGARFVVENYNWSRAFSNFLPGIAGRWGVPLWSYYVNRGQAVCSLGIRDKDGQILEFHSFNKACMTVPRQGFRTFLLLDDGRLYEPFQRTRDPDVFQQLTVAPGELEIRETHRGLQLEMGVRYYLLAGSRVGAFVRQVRLRDLSGCARRLQWVDGVSRILPAGLDQQTIKFIPRHIEAWMGVAEVEGLPLFRLRQAAADVERIDQVEGGNFYVPVQDGQPLASQVVVDLDCLFGDSMNVDRPWLFEEEGAAGALSRSQMRGSKTPCAFTVMDQELPAGGVVGLGSLIGHVERDEDLRWLVSRLRDPTFLEQGRDRSNRVLDEIMDRSFTVSAEPAFDAYCRQNFLDNVMRGGMPLAVETADGPGVFYTFSRQNGDLERDYHFFVLEPGYLSQGTGHYRSVLQNRRMDGWFFPEIGDANLRTFLDLVQLDGYNPLEVGRTTYHVAHDRRFDAWLAARVRDPEHREALRDLARGGFSPGGFLLELERRVGPLEESREELLSSLLLHCREGEAGGLHEGFWVDHWTYLLDLLDTYEAVYPERLAALLLERRIYRFFDDPDVIRPRDDKTVRVERGVRRYGAVVRDPEKQARIQARLEAEGPTRAWSVRTDHGEGEVYRVNLLVKLLVLLANRIATLDPSGLGVDMEADKPGWNDSMNGLPGIFGSAVNETLELLRLARYLDSALEALEGSGREPVPLFTELSAFMAQLQALLEERGARQGTEAAFAWWDAANTAKERYREATRLGVEGGEQPWSLAEIRAFVGRCRELLEAIFSGANREHLETAEGVPRTYFVHEVDDWEDTDRVRDDGLPLVRPRSFRLRSVGLFLEGPVHTLRVRPEEARRVYEAVRGSPLYDRKLRMYKNCQDMTGEDPELGRAVGAYPRGWIENESIYLHMEYKYLLEILRSGLCDAYFEDMRNALVCFQPPERYGRSVLEGASFVVSSAYADPKHHGQAFQPRLSGITCEFVHQWTLMTAGPRPFRVDGEGALELALRPRLAPWLFTKQPVTRPWCTAEGEVLEVEVPVDAFAFCFLGRTLVVYRNPSRLPTWGEEGARPARYRLAWPDGREKTVEGSVVPAKWAQEVRAGRVRRITVDLAPAGAGG